MRSRRLLVAAITAVFMAAGATSAAAADKAGLDPSLAAESGSEITERGFTELIDGKKVDRPSS